MGCTFKQKTFANGADLAVPGEEDLGGGVGRGVAVTMRIKAARAQETCV